MPRKTFKNKDHNPEQGLKGKKKAASVRRTKVPVNVVNLKKEVDIKEELEVEKEAARVEKARILAEKAAKDSIIETEDGLFIQYEREERKKRAIMYLGISAIMLVVAVLWFLNFRNNLEQASLARENSAAEKYDIDKISEEFKNTMDRMTAELEKAQTQQNTLPTGLTASTTAGKVDIVSLKARLEEKAVASSTGLNASSTIAK